MSIARRGGFGSESGFPATVEVSTTQDVRRRGIWIHRVTGFGPGEVGEVDGIPCTSPARTILDLAGRLDEDTLEQLTRQPEAVVERIAAALRLRVAATC